MTAQTYQKQKCAYQNLNLLIKVQDNIQNLVKSVLEYDFQDKANDYICTMSALINTTLY